MAQASDPTEVLGYLVKQVHLRLGEAADRALAPFGLDRKSFGVLRVLLADEPLSQQELARRLGVDTTTMVTVIDGLEEEGILTRRPDPADRRRNAIELTPAGRSTQVRAEAAYVAAEAAFLGPLGVEHAAEFRRMLQVLLAG